MDVKTQVLLDSSKAYFAAAETRYGFSFGQFRTPLTCRRIHHDVYGLDNGCFAKFKLKTWLRMVREAREHQPLFVAVPDTVGDAAATLERFYEYKEVTSGVPRCFVLQDGAEEVGVPWKDIRAVFVGGTDAFKESTAAVELVKHARKKRLHVHVGRVNTRDRMEFWKPYADSIDGSGISRYHRMLDQVMQVVQSEV